MSVMPILNPCRMLHFCKGTLVLSANKRVLVQIPACSRAVNLWQRDRRSGYGPEKKRSKLESIKKGFQIMKEDVSVFKEEVKENVIDIDRNIGTFHGDYQYFARFNDQETVDSWIVTADSDHKEGKSYAKFELNNSNKGVFHGYLNTEVPKDGRVRRAGYTNIRSPLNKKAFGRFEPYDWSGFTHLYVRCRGDGRPYMLIVSMHRFFDTMWDDQYHYPLYTQGGPYWQTTKIPLSKFFLTHKGRIQDKQGPMEESQVRSVGITLADDVTGPFKLELDFIALTCDQTHTEEFAYEMYQVKKFQAGV